MSEEYRPPPQDRYAFEDRTNALCLHCGALIYWPYWPEHDEFHAEVRATARQIVRTKSRHRRPDEAEREMGAP